MTSKVFIASSSESQNLAVTLQSLLERHCSVQLWAHSVFETNRGNLENLLNALPKYDFACILATPDDRLTSRDEEFLAPRDNLLFEFGLFLAALGRDRVFFLYPRSPRMKLPSDLLGLTLLDYKPIDSDNSPANVLGPPAETIRQAILDHGARSATTLTRRYSPVLGRGDRVSMIADAALYYSRPRFGHKEEIRRHILSDEVIPASYYYVTEEGAKSWMSMTTNSKYRFQNSSLSLVKSFAPTFTNALSAAGGPRLDVDFISLGSGDGEKDRILLGGITNSERTSVAYYPIDISDKLLVEGIRRVFAGPLDYAGIQTKAIIGDFTDLSLLRTIYEDRPSPNVFSVLGNTFGNTDEAQILNALRESMYPGDFLLVEINCDLTDLGTRNAFLSSEEGVKYTCLPILILGLQIDPSHVRISEESDLSVFACARSAATYYDHLTLDGVDIPTIRLFHDHRYDFEQFKSELAEYLDLEIVRAQRRGSAGIVLAKKA